MMNQIEHATKQIDAAVEDLNRIYPNAKTKARIAWGPSDCALGELDKLTGQQSGLLEWLGVSYEIQLSPSRDESPPTCHVHLLVNAAMPLPLSPVRIWRLMDACRNMQLGLVNDEEEDLDDEQWIEAPESQANLHVMSVGYSFPVHGFSAKFLHWILGELSCAHASVCAILQGEDA